MCHCSGAHDNTVTGKHADVDISMFTSHGIIIMYPTPVTHIPIDRNTYLHQHVYQSRYYHHVPHYSDTYPYRP
jgi:hypothetical protein